MKSKIALILSFILLGVLSLVAQETNPAAGGDLTGDGSASYTVGQIVYTTNSDANGSVAQGIQQPFEISIVLGVAQEEILLELAVYPNPTTDFLNLRIKNFGVNEMSYQLYDILGKQLKQEQLKNKTTRINMTQLKTAAYFLRVSENNKVIKIFKIIKR